MIPIVILADAPPRQLMAKAAIEIPDDYLGGLRRCADTEKGDLSAFVIQAMLENYEAAKEDRRAMCGDTGVPRWYVKIGNEARIEGGPVALEAALRRATANATHDVPLRPNRVHPLWRTDHNNNCRHRRAGDRILVPSRGRLDRPHHRAQGRPVRLRLPHAVSRRRHRRHQALLPRHADRSSASAGSPASRPSSASASAAPRTSRMVLGKQAACLRIGRLAQSRSQDRRAGGRS